LAIIKTKIAVIIMRTKIFIFLNLSYI
jgi:hypothetical protein